MLVIVVMFFIVVLVVIAVMLVTCCPDTFRRYFWFVSLFTVSWTCVCVCLFA